MSYKYVLWYHYMLSLKRINIINYTISLSIDLSIFDNDDSFDNIQNLIHKFSTIFNDYFTN